MTKLGRLANADLDKHMSMIKTCLHRRPEHAMALVVAPCLTSARVKNGLRGEIRQGVFCILSSTWHGGVIQSLRWLAAGGWRTKLKTNLCGRS